MPHKNGHSCHKLVSPIFDGENCGWRRHKHLVISQEVGNHFLYPSITLLWPMSESTMADTGSPKATLPIPSDGKEHDGTSMRNGSGIPVIWLVVVPPKEVNEEDNNASTAVTTIKETAIAAKTSEKGVKSPVTAITPSIPDVGLQGNGQIHFLCTKSKHIIILFDNQHSRNEPSLIPLKEWINKHHPSLSTKLHFVGYYNMKDPTSHSKSWLSTSKFGNTPRTAFLFKFPLASESVDGEQKQAKLIANTIRTILSNHLRSKYHPMQNWRIGLDLTPLTRQPLLHYIHIEAVAAVVCKTFRGQPWKDVASNKLAMNVYFGNTKKETILATIESITKTLQPSKV